MSRGNEAKWPDTTDDESINEADALGRTPRVEPADVGEFAQSLMLELRQMALGARCTYLAYLLELALIEASDLAAGRAPSLVTGSEVGLDAKGEAAPDLEEIAQRILTAKG